MQIPFVDLQRSASSTRHIINKIEPLIRSGTFILGTDVQAFESAFSGYIGTKYCIGVASGTDAIFLSLKALAIGNNDEVIVPAMTFISSANAVIYTGAKPVFVDISSDTPTIAVTNIEEKITNKTKAIIPVHMQGMPCDMKEILRIAQKYHLFVIEDACQAHGSLYNQKKTGTFGKTAAFSFYPSKNLGAFGDAGAIVTSDKKLAEKLSSIRHHGQRKKDMHSDYGFNSRLDTVQAVVLLDGLSHLDKNNALRRKHAATYRKLLQDLPIILPTFAEDVIPNFHLFSIQVKERDELKNYLAKKGISCGIHYPSAMHLHPSLKFLGYKKGDFPNAERFAKENLSLPMYPGLTQKQIVYIAEQIHSFFTGRR